MDDRSFGGSRAFYTVKQLAALFGKSEDTVRRWKNEGIGREEDNVRLRAVESADGEGRKNARHLVFSREAVIEFVRANPFLMDEAPELGKMMEAEDAWHGRAIPMPGEVEHSDFKGLAPVVSQSREQRTRPSVRPVYSARFLNAAMAEDEDDFEEEIFPPRESAKQLRERLRRESGFGREWTPPTKEEREAAERACAHRMEVIRYALSCLEEKQETLEGEKQELIKAMGELSASGMDSAGAIKKVLEDKCAELENKKAMLKEFVELIEEEIRED